MVAVTVCSVNLSIESLLAPKQHKVNSNTQGETRLLTHSNTT
uniref:Uncharacterized protein n=1 Tax=Anguilla anguilla TaxID=7936 RepID=A0A0E9U780_ANGAN